MSTATLSFRVIAGPVRLKSDGLAVTLSLLVRSKHKLGGLFAQLKPLIYGDHQVARLLRAQTNSAKIVVILYAVHPPLCRE